MNVATAPDSDKPKNVLLDVHAVARLLDCSTNHVRRLADAGKMPRPVRIGHLIRWRVRDVERWLESGCPRCSR